MQHDGIQPASRTSCVGSVEIKVIQLRGKSRLEVNKWYCDRHQSLGNPPCECINMGEQFFQLGLSMLLL
jgi:hypothetical protein